MSLDPNRWVSTLPNVCLKSDLEIAKLDSNKWVSTISKIKPKSFL